MKGHLLKAAEGGNAEAQFNLAVICENGWIDSRYVVEGDRREAMRWLNAAAEQGLPRAQIKLAEIYAGESPQTGKFGEGLRMVSVGSCRPERHPSPKCAERLPAHLGSADAGPDSEGQALCGGVDGKGPHRKARERARMITAWIVPPIVIPALMGLAIAILSVVRGLQWLQ